MTGSDPHQCQLLDVERRFGVLGCRTDGVRTGTAQPGPWLLAEPGRVRVGAVAVLVDHAIGEVFFNLREPDHWSLTTELSMDVVVSPPWPTSLLHVAPVALHRDATGGLGEARLVDDAGTLLVTTTAWVRYVPAPAGSPPPTVDQSPVDSSGACSLEEVLGCEVVAGPGRASVHVPKPQTCANVYGAIHGGVWAALVEMTGAEAIRPRSRELVTAHVRLSYLRAATPGSPVTMTGRVTHQGRTFAEVEVVGLDGEGRRCVSGTVTARRPF